jgi:hypothetical protein
MIIRRGNKKQKLKGNTMFDKIEYYGKVLLTIFTICSPAIFFGLAWIYTDQTGLSTLCTLLGIFSFDWADKAKMPEKPIKA